MRERLDIALRNGRELNMARAPADIIIPVDSNAVTSRYEPIFFG